ncbi:MAG: hypothetical protein KA419_12230 [Acidobacteria bacterium]|nr:hypothetical protein [Acidobacteriota bacterium]
MDRANRRSAKVRIGAGVLLAFLVLGACLAQGDAHGGFDPARWDLSGAKLLDVGGRKALAGVATLRDVDFGDGVLEADFFVAGDRARSYPGLFFRIRPGGSWERIYLRPHRHALYADVVQYVPSFNRVDSWQLYHGPGCTAPATLPVGRWFHVRVEVAGTAARVFLGDDPRPCLVVDRLRHGVSRGTVGVWTPPDGSACASNFTWRAADSLKIETPPPADPPPGVVRSWQLSRSFPFLEVDMEKNPGEQGLGDPAWQDVTAEPDGLVDVARYRPRSGAPDVVLARTVLRAEADEVRKLNLGYSDAVSVFLNGRILFSGDSSYTSRDASFLGIVGLQDAVYLPLKKGDNELVLMVAESMGGWGFKAQDGTAVFTAPGVSRRWEARGAFRIPESAAWDPASKAVYVSSYDPFDRRPGEGRQFISKLAPDGRVEKADWVTGLRNPAGLAVHGGTLYAAEPTALVEIDIPTARLTRRTPVEGAVMLNDVAVGPDGAVYLSDSVKNVIYRVMEGKPGAWLEGEAVSRPNGVSVAGGKLYWGNNGDQRLKSADLATREVRTVAAFGPGILDGVVCRASGDILVSHNEGRLYRVGPDGAVTRLLDTSVIGANLADFAWAPELGLVIVPAWVHNRVSAWALPGK